MPRVIQPGGDGGKMRVRNTASRKHGLVATLKRMMSPSSFLGGFGIHHMSSPTPEPVARTSSYGTPSGDDDERLPPRPVAHGAAVAADAASPREHTLLVKRTLRVSHSLSAMSALPARRGNGK